MWICIVFCATEKSFSQQKNDSLLNDSSKKYITDEDSLPVVKDAMKADVIYSAEDTIYFDAENKIVHLWGNAVADYEKIHLAAAYIYIDFKNNTLHAQPMTDSSGNPYGKPDFKDGDKQYKAEKIVYNFKSKRGKISGLITKEGEGIIYCNEVKKDAENNLYGTNARYSTCTDTLHPHFYINATKLKIIPKKQIVTGPANLVIEDVPTPAFLPFGFFPVTSGKKKGLIFPAYGNSPATGVFLKDAGYYLPLGDHIDLKLFSTIYENGSYGGKVNSSYNYRYRFTGNFLAEYNSIIFGDKDVPSTFGRNNVYSLKWTHTVDPKANPGSTFSINIDARSSGYSKTVPTASYSDLTQNILNSSISYNKTFNKGKYALSASARHSQNTQTHDVSLSLPDLAFTVNSFAPFARKNQIGTLKWYENIRVGYSNHIFNQVNVKEENLFSKNITDSFKNGIYHNIPINLPTISILKYFKISPTINYDEYWYSESIFQKFVPVANRLDVFSEKGFKRAYSWSTGASMTTKIYGMFNINRWNISTIRHTMTPQISFSYSPDFSDVKYGFYKYSRPDSTQFYPQKYSIFQGSINGGPQAGQRGTLNFSLQNNVEMKYKSKTDTSVKINKISLLDQLNFNAGYNFLADSFRLSNITMIGSTKLFKKVQVNFGGTIDPYKNNSLRRIDVYDFSLQNLHFGRISDARLAMSGSFSSSDLKKKKESKFGTEAEKKEIKNNPLDYIDFNIPWSVNAGLNFTYSKAIDGKITFIEALTLSGSASITQKWKVNFNTGYDIYNKAVTTTSVDISRDLHCWDMTFNWVPIGPFKRYLFTIKARSSLLQDLKLTRQRNAWDR